MIEIIPHTADVRLRISAASVDELFREALRGLMACMEPHAAGESSTRTREVVLSSVDRTALLVDFLNDALTTAIVAREMYTDVRLHSLNETAVVATLVASPATFGVDVKAVTYHEAEVVHGDDGTWSTMLVLDI